MQSHFVWFSIYGCACDEWDSDICGEKNPSRMKKKQNIYRRHDIKCSVFGRTSVQNTLQYKIHMTLCKIKRIALIGAISMLIRYILMLR